MHENIIRAFEEARSSQGLSITDVARRIYAPEKVGRCAGRVHDFFRQGKGGEQLVLRIAGALGIPRQRLVDLANKDSEEEEAKWNAWADQPIRPFLFIRWMPTVYSRIPLPVGLGSEEELIRAALEARGDRKIRCCLVASRRLSIWLDAEGKVESRTMARHGVPNMASMSFGRKSIALRFE